MSKRYEVAPPDIENPYLYRVVDHEDDAVVSSHPSWAQAHTVAAALNNPRPAPARPELDALIRQAIDAYNAMTPEQKELLHQAQRESWARGNIDIDRGPDARRTVTPPAPCCNCRERMEKYRVTLNKIARHTDDEYARRSADDALCGGA